MKSAKGIFQIMKEAGCRQITFHHNPATDMSAILVVDSIQGKSASGGTRFAHQDADIALQDALKLSRAMTRKTKVLGIREGGAKAVILANKPKSKKFLQSVGDFIQTQKGLFKTAVDLGFNLHDAKIIASRSDFVDSLSHSQKGLGSTGENTAEGMMHGFGVISDEILKKPLQKCSIAVQGLGAVGMALTKRLLKRGCKVIATDVNKKWCNEARKLGARIVKPEKIFSQKVDIFSPCALGGVLNEQTIPELKCKVVAGGANNPLEDERKGDKQLLERRIIFVPDFVLNCAGFLQALVERNDRTVEEAREKSKIVREKLLEVIKLSRKKKCGLLEAGLELFEKKK
jgi:leucine dehydrogenase